MDNSVDNLNITGIKKTKSPTFVGFWADKSQLLTFANNRHMSVFSCVDMGIPLKSFKEV